MSEESPQPPENKQCPTCRFWTEPLPNGLIPEHPLPFGTTQLCPGETTWKPRLVKKPTSSEEI